jgi:hypothetical protein
MDWTPLGASGPVRLHTISTGGASETSVSAQWKAAAIKIMPQSRFNRVDVGRFDSRGVFL